jgi:Fe-S cluster assembly protein SufD
MQTELNAIATVTDNGYLARLLNLFTPTTEGWLQQLRNSAANFVQESTFPTTRDEEWRFTDLSSLRQVELKLDKPDLTSLEIDVLPEAANSRLVFVNGVYTPDLSAVANLPAGVVVSNLSGLSRLNIQQYLAQAEGNEVFTALNTAGISDVAVVWVLKDIVVETPIHLLFVTTGKSSISQPRCLVVVGNNSEVRILEEYTAQAEVYFTNAVTEIWVDENAQVTHTRIERDSTEAFHVGKTAVTQARYSRYTCNAIAFGGQVYRHNLQINQTGEQTETTLNGLTMIRGNQLADTHSTLSLHHPYGVSRQLQKNIVGDRAHAVFNGKVFVPKLAQLTDAGQLNRNLLLSSKARVDTKPQLEITADNVKCAHGATVSQLEDDEIFYLQSRGIDQNNARNLLINAFASEIINKISVPSLREKLLGIVKEF